MATDKPIPNWRKVTPLRKEQVERIATPVVRRTRISGELNDFMSAVRSGEYRFGDYVPINTYEKRGAALALANALNRAAETWEEYTKGGKITPEAKRRIQYLDMEPGQFLSAYVVTNPTESIVWVALMKEQVQR